MKSRKKKKQSPQKRLLDIFSRHLAKMPANEAEKRIEKLKKIIEDDPNDHAKPQGQGYNPVTPYAARSR